MENLKINFQLFAEDTGATDTSTTEVDTSTDVDTTATADTTSTTQATTSTDEYEIEGIGKLTKAEILEYKNGYMRQSDYTKKTQDISKQRQETKDAIDLYNYLKANPDIAGELMQPNIVDGKLQKSQVADILNTDDKYADLNSKFASLELDNEITRLKSKYPDFNEVDVLNKADEIGVTNLEFVYNALQGEKVPSMQETLRNEIRRQLTEEIKANGLATTTTINSGDTSTESSGNKLTDAQKNIAMKMGISEEDYIKGINARL